MCLLTSWYVQRSSCRQQLAACLNKSCTMAKQLSLACVCDVSLNLCLLQNSYGTGLTDWDNCSMYGKLVLFIFAAWAGSTVSVDNPSCLQTVCCSKLYIDRSKALSTSRDLWYIRF